MSDPVDTICALVGCSREDAEISYARTNNVVDSVDELIVVPKPAFKLPMKRKRELTSEEEEISRIRDLMEKAEADIQKNINASNQSAQHESRMPSIISEVEIPELQYLDASYKKH